MQDIVTDPEYLDITLNPDSQYIHSVKKGHNVFTYIIEGEGFFDDNKEELVSKEMLVIFGDGNGVKITTNKERVRLLLISGKPLRESVA